MIQFIYNSDTVEKNFWGCYANIELEDERLVVVNTLNNYTLSIFGAPDTLKTLYEALYAGVSDDELINLLARIGYEHILDELIYRGMIE